MTTMKGAFSLVHNPSLFLTSPSLHYRVPHKFKCLSSPPSSFTRIVCKAATNLHADVRIPEKENNFPELATDPEDEEKESISRISVPRERYISVSKVQLLQALASLFQNPKDAQQFLDIATCIDCILHAEHKSILEEMRSDYCFTHGLASDLSLNSGHEYSASNEGANFEINGKVKDTNVSPPDEVNSASSYIPSNHSEHGTDSFAEYNTVTADEKASITADVRFQQNFMRLLHAAEFQELSAYDLQLSSALNSDYLLTLPIDVDWKRASLSNPIIFRRGYTTEKQEGLLLGEKFDYLQSRILQKIFGSLSTPVISTGMWMNKVRLDTTTILGLSAYFINYRFEDISGSISAFTLDLVAFGALIVFLTRVVLGYKQTWDRYQDCPQLLFCGPFGVGKKTLIMALLK